MVFNILLEIYYSQRQSSTLPGGLLKCARIRQHTKVLLRQVVTHRRDEHPVQLRDLRNSRVWSVLSQTTRDVNGTDCTFMNYCPAPAPHTAERVALNPASFRAASNARDHSPHRASA